MDVGFATLPITAKDKEVIMPIVHSLHCVEPNCCMHIYKVRRGKLSKVRLWVYYDAGTMRITDCFVTNNDYELLDVDDTNIEVILEENVEDPMEAFQEPITAETSPISEVKEVTDDWY